jgi:hypothetical protein
MSVSLLDHPRRYRHYKGGVYEIVTEARLEATEELVFVYRNVETGDVWVRPRADFDDMVNWQGQQVPRFSEVLQ